MSAPPHLEGVAEGDAGELWLEAPVVGAGGLEDAGEGSKVSLVAFVEVEERLTVNRADLLDLPRAGPTLAGDRF